MDFKIGEPRAFKKTSFNFKGVNFFQDEKVVTKTSRDQKSCEGSCATLLHSIVTTTEKDAEGKVTEVSEDIGELKYEQLFERINTKKTVLYMLKTLNKALSPAYVSLEASRPWLLYWSVESLKLLNFDLDRRFYSSLTEEELKDKDLLAAKSLNCLKDCWNAKSGGWGGGKGHFAHTAPTYAAVLALVTIGTSDCLEYLYQCTKRTYQFLFSVKDACGGFRVQLDGEIDTRGLYTTLCVADLTNTLTKELAENCFSFIKSCQTYEGGFGGEPYNEAHGGYAFCAVAALAILYFKGLISETQLKQINLKATRDWIAHRQMSLEGGFQGRTNKLVDSCYSFWQGAIPVVLEMLDSGKQEVAVDWMEAEPLWKYVVLCCQDDNGGLRDKPGKSRDQYHSCYSLSGLSVSQHYYKSGKTASDKKLTKLSVLHGVAEDKLESLRQFMNNKPLLTHKQLLDQPM